MDAATRLRLERSVAWFRETIRRRGDEPIDGDAVMMAANEMRSAIVQALANKEPPDGFFTCPLCGDPERKEDGLCGVCLACSDAIAFEQHNRRSRIIVVE